MEKFFKDFHIAKFQIKIIAIEMIFNIFKKSDKDLLKKVFESMELLEHDYLGGMGPCGYGKIKLDNITVFWNTAKDYETGNLNQNKIYESDLTEDEKKTDISLVSKIVKEFDKTIKSKLGNGGEIK